MLSWGYARISHEVVPMSRQLPPLNALRAFEAAARHQSFTKAALDLGVTQGAVSHQVKALELRLGLKLFVRERQRLILTDPGRAYLEVVRDAFDRISDGTDELLRQRNGGVLTVSVSPNFAAKWLVHRLGRFGDLHSDIDLRIAASMQHVDFAREDVDIAIRHGEGQWPGLSVTKLCAEDLFPVCSPLTARNAHGLRKPADLASCALIHVDDRSNWQKWIDHVAAGDVDVSRGTIFNQASVAIDAAVDGQGVVIARTALAAWDLLAGRLVRPFRETLPASFGYYIVCPKASAGSRKITVFRDWLVAQAVDDAARLDQLFAS